MSRGAASSSEKGAGHSRSAATVGTAARADTAGTRVDTVAETASRRSATRSRGQAASWSISRLRAGGGVGAGAHVGVNVSWSRGLLGGRAVRRGACTARNSTRDTAKAAATARGLAGAVIATRC